MLRTPGHKILRQLWSQTGKPSVIFNTVHSSSEDVCRLAIEPGSASSNAYDPDRARSREQGWRQYSTSGKGFRTFGALQQGVAEPLQPPVHLPSDILPDDLVMNVAQHLKVIRLPVLTLLVRKKQTRDQSRKPRHY